VGGIRFKNVTGVKKHVLLQFFIFKFHSQIHIKAVQKNTFLKQTKHNNTKK